MKGSFVNAVNKHLEDFPFLYHRSFCFEDVIHNTDQASHLYTRKLSLEKLAVAKMQGHVSDKQVRENRGEEM